MNQDQKKRLAPRAGFEPATQRLTASIGYKANAALRYPQGYP
jgi:hypothetical protein